MPEELTGPIPRPVTLDIAGNARGLCAIVLLFFFGGSLWLGWKGYDDFQQMKQRAALRADIHVVTGIVIGFPSGRGPSKVRYRFTFNGATYSNEVEEQRFHDPSEALHIDDQILIRFLPANPTVNHPDAWEWSPTIEIEYVVFAVFFWAIGGVVLIFLLRNRTLARFGKAAAGVVLGCTRDGRLFQVEYEFRPEGGVSMRGKTSGPQEHEVGSTIWILYLRQNPRRNSRYPLDFFEVAG